MRFEKWESYLDKLQGHPSLACISVNKNDINNLIKDFMPAYKYKKMLDIGCADGSETNALKELGYNVIGIGRGKNNEQYAKETFDNIDVRACDMHDLSFLDESFDCIFMNHTLEHCFAPLILLLEMNRVLRINGKIFTRMPVFDDRNEIDAGIISFHHPCLLTIKQWEQLFNLSGFSIFQSKSHFDGYLELTYYLIKIKNISY